METPLRGRSGGHTGAAPTVSFGQIGCGMVGFVWVDCAQTVGVLSPKNNYEVYGKKFCTL